MPQRPKIRPLARLFGALILACLLSPLVSPSAAVAAPNTPSSGFGLQAATKGKPDSRPNFTYGVTPGATATDQVAVFNLSPKPVTLDVYATDATVDAQGNFALLAAADKPKLAGTWITLRSPRTITVPARTQAGPSYKIIDFGVDIPQNAQPGDHAAGIIVSLNAKAESNQGLGVDLDQRVAYRVNIRVSGDLRGQLAIQNLKLRYVGPSIVGSPLGKGSAVVTYRVSNTGNVTLGAHQTVKLSSWLSGAVEARGLTDVPPLLPGTHLDVSTTVHGVFPGVRVNAAVTLHPVVPQGGVDPHAPDVTASTSVWAWPWTPTWVTGLLVCIALAWWWGRIRPARKRKRAGLGPRHTKAPVAAGGVNR